MEDPPADLSRIGLARFRSAPSIWLDTLLEHHDPPKLSGPPLLTSTHPNPTPTQLDPGCFGMAFQRMNSSPAEFLSGSYVDGYYSTYGVSSNSFDFGGGGGGGVVAVSGKRLREGDSQHHSPTSNAQTQERGELAKANSLVEMEMEKLLEDSVACRVRAKRGCATHPRSIAERVRRTRISDRIRKLQELVPNMDKQVNTSDMLEEAVEYVKTLQRQIQELTEQQKKCKCMPKS